MKKYLSLAFIAIFTAFIACDDEDPEIPHEDELITTVVLTFSPVEGGDDVEFRFTDLDAEEHDHEDEEDHDEEDHDDEDAEIINGTLAANTEYTASITFLNELETPVEDITAEIEEEADEHQVIYEIEDDVNITFAYADEDNNGNDLGLETTWTTGAASTGHLDVVLKHEPTKPNDGTISGSGGSTDVSVEFELTIE